LYNVNAKASKKAMATLEGAGAKIVSLFGNTEQTGLRLAA
jgi:hypothetical protein